MKKYETIRKEAQEKYNELLKQCKVFWAFSDKQFNENKTELSEGDKYVSIGAGGYMPKFYIKELRAGMDSIDKWEKDEIKKTKAEEKHILYELYNHECFYTGDLTSAIDVLPYSVDKVQKVYQENREKQL